MVRSGIISMLGYAFAIDGLRSRKTDSTMVASNKPTNLTNRIDRELVTGTSSSPVSTSSAFRLSATSRADGRSTGFFDRQRSIKSASGAPTPSMAASEGAGSFVCWSASWPTVFPVNGSSPATASNATMPSEYTSLAVPTAASASNYSGLMYMAVPTKAPVAVRPGSDPPSAFAIPKSVSRAEFVLASRRMFDGFTSR